MRQATRWKAWLGSGLWIVLALPPVRHLLEASMTLQMLVQIPLLAMVGWLWQPLVPVRATAWLERWNRSGISGIVLVSVAAMVWMLPRAMDASLEMPWVELAKFSCVPALIGLPLALSWPRAGFVVRGVFLAEVIATAFRMGWLYLASPQRLCSNYLLGDQQLLGRLMLGVGVATCVMLVGKLVWGRVGIVDGSSR